MQPAGVLVQYAAFKQPKTVKAKLAVPEAPPDLGEEELDTTQSVKWSGISDHFERHWTQRHKDTMLRLSEKAWEQEHLQGHFFVVVLVGPIVWDWCRQQ